jgi:hypothetical protein
MNMRFWALFTTIIYPRNVLSLCGDQVYRARFLRIQAVHVALRHQHMLNVPGD